MDCGLAQIDLLPHANGKAVAVAVVDVALVVVALVVVALVVDFNAVDMCCNNKIFDVANCMMLVAAAVVITCVIGGGEPDLRY